MMNMMAVVGVVVIQVTIFNLLQRILAAQSTQRLVDDRTSIHSKYNYFCPRPHTPTTPRIQPNTYHRSNGCFFPGCKGTGAWKWPPSTTTAEGIIQKARLHLKSSIHIHGVDTSMVWRLIKHSNNFNFTWPSPKGSTKAKPFEWTQICTKTLQPTHWTDSRGLRMLRTVYSEHTQKLHFQITGTLPYIIISNSSFIKRSL
jgi:hypothetical protein